MSQFFHEKLLQHKEEGLHEELGGIDQMSLLLRQSQEKSDTPYAMLEPSLDDRIKEMCQTVIAAGSETTGSTLTALAYFVATTQGVLSKLLSEIESVSENVLPDGTFSSSTVRCSNNLRAVRV